MKEFVFSAIFKKEPKGGYSALCPELGVASQGENIEDAKTNLREACELYIESAKDVGMIKKVLEEINEEGKEATPILTGSIRTKVNI